jgi:hypothetical protein
MHLTFRQPLAVKLSLVFCGVAAMTMLSLGCLWGYLTIQHARAAALEQTLTSARLAALYVESFVSQTQDGLTALSLEPAMVDEMLAGNRNGLNARLEAVVPALPELTVVLVLDVEARVFATSESDKSTIGDSRANERHVLETLTNGTVSVGEPRLG